MCLERKIIIYIPLCFYCISGSRRMFSFLPLIYIPLCFYCIRGEDYLLTATDKIYIPLCFYCIMPGKRTVQARYHNLHSIMLLLYRRHIHASGWPCGFTFHYASTVSASRVFTNTTIFDLHSIMLLLYHIIPRILSIYLLNLHSIMLLLYPVSIFPFYFLQCMYAFCLPLFLNKFFSQIIYLLLHKI